MPHNTYLHRLLILGTLAIWSQTFVFAELSETTVEDTTSTPAFTELTLPPRWNSSLGSGIEAMRELLGVISPFCNPDGSIKIEKYPEIKGGVTLMMPLNEALAKLQINQMIPAKQAIAFPGIPFYYRIFTNPARDGFNLVYVITDGADRVVALQYVNETPKENTWLGPGTEHVPKNILTYNFINSRKRATRTLEVQTAVTSRELDAALPISNLLEREAEHTSRAQERTARLGNLRENSLQKTEAQLQSVKERLALSEKQLEQMRKTHTELEKSNVTEASRLERDILNKETLIFNDKDLLKRVQDRYDSLVNRSGSTDSSANRSDSQETLCIQTLLFDQKRFRTLEVVHWYVPRSIASFIHQNLLTQIGPSSGRQP